MRGEDQDSAVRHFANLLDKNRAAFTQTVHHVAVVHHFVTNVNWRAINGERIFNNADSAVNACTKAAWVGQQDLHVTPPVPDRLPVLQYQNERYGPPADG